MLVITRLTERIGKLSQSFHTLFGEIEEAAEEIPANVRQMPVTPEEAFSVEQIVLDFLVKNKINGRMNVVTLRKNLAESIGGAGTESIEE